MPSKEIFGVIIVAAVGWLNLIPFCIFMYFVFKGMLLSLKWQAQCLREGQGNMLKAILKIANPFCYSEMAESYPEIRLASRKILISFLACCVMALVSTGVFIVVALMLRR